MRRPGASRGGGLSRAATHGPDRWLFTTELGLQVQLQPKNNAHARQERFPAAYARLFML